MLHTTILINFKQSMIIKQFIIIPALFISTQTILINFKQSMINEQFIIILTLSFISIKRNNFDPRWSFTFRGFFLKFNPNNFFLPLYLKKIWTRVLHRGLLWSWIYGHRALTLFKPLVYRLCLSSHCTPFL